MIDKMKKQFSDALAHHEAQLVHAEEVLLEERRSYLYKLIYFILIYNFKSFIYYLFIYLFFRNARKIYICYQNDF